MARDASHFTQEIEDIVGEEVVPMTCDTLHQMTGSNDAWQEFEQFIRDKCKLKDDTDLTPQMVSVPYYSFVGLGFL